MGGDWGYRPAGAMPPQRRGLGIAALVLGIVAIITLLVCGFGAVLAVIGLIVGIIAIVRNNGRGMAIVGVVLSAMTLVATIGLAVWFYTRVAPCADRNRYPTKADRDRCLEQRVPFFRATPRSTP